MTGEMKLRKERLQAFYRLSPGAKQQLKEAWVRYEMQRARNAQRYRRQYPWPERPKK